MGGLIQRLKQFVKTQKGFTLIELMAVLAILALILLIAVPAGGAMIEKAKKSADESSIALMEDAGEKAHVDKLPFDAVDAELPEEESYKIPTLVEEGYLKLEEDSKFFAPENYVKKKNKGGEFIYKGTGSGDETAGEPVEKPYVAMTCEEATGQGYICIDTPEELNDIRNNLSGKYIMMADIDLASFANWAPIGTTAAPFTGELNGNTFAISNMNITSYAPINVGLFGVARSGTFQHLTLKDFALNNNVAVTGSLRIGGLVGLVDADGTNNPEATGVTIKDVDGNVAIGLTTAIATKSSTLTGGLVGSISTNADVEVSQVDLLVNHLSTAGTIGGVVGSISTKTGTPVANVSFAKVTVSGELKATGTVSGIAGSISMSKAAAGSFTAKELLVSANLTGDRVDGLSNYVSLNSSASDKIITAIESVDVSGVLSGGYMASGLVATLYASNVTIKDINITSKMTADNTLGLSNDFYTSSGSNPGGKYVIVEDISVTSDMTYQYLGVGTFGSLYMYKVAGDVTIQNVNVDSDIIYGKKLGALGNARGFIHTLDADIDGNILMTNIHVAGLYTGGEVVGIADLLFPSYGRSYNADGSNDKFELSNVTMTAELRGEKTKNPSYGQPMWPGGPLDLRFEYFDGNVYGLLGNNNGTEVYNKFLFKDIALSGKMSVDKGNVFGVTDYVSFYLDNASTTLGFDNVDVTSEMVATVGDINPFIEDLEIERTSDGGYWNYYDGADYSDTPITELDALTMKNNSIPAAGNMSAPLGEIRPGLVNK